MGDLNQGMTLTEKILAKASGLSRVVPGDYVWVDIDVALTHEALGPWLIDEDFQRLGGKLWDPKRLVITIDHYNLPVSLSQAEVNKKTTEWAKRYGVKNFYPYDGPSHQMMIEHGHTLPGAVIIGTDSHTVTAGAFGAFATGIGSTEFAFAISTGKMWFRVPPTLNFNWKGKLRKGVMAKDMILRMIQEVGAGGANYKAVEFRGETIQTLSMDGRICICNMAIEMGAKNGLISPDENTIAFLRGRIDKLPPLMESDKDACYERTYPLQADLLEPLVACPPTLDKVRPAKELSHVKVDQVVIGTCTGGRFEDMEMAAKILRGKKVHPDTRTLVLPASWKIYRKCLDAGLIHIFLDAKTIVANPGCGPCAGLHQGFLAAGETCLSSQNRNFTGRMGSPKSEVYVASPATCAASALEGRIVDPRGMIS